ncbi:hypothetical protein PLESTB_000831000 [Pleodorina starrii]|uniref:Uncharacterized protein n=1 Tax=Pleodorina starrii TaxID=330485 RepID=A0A9W6BLF0_9CHLO|nr:hypothetical protein PLESTM_000146300 [Pleodorina starrii]GLC34038.1 hypothetical protein PLESTM_000146600 [Pleodorina starrii]GLC34041.1 hypothetical protein PLESTM_000146900 [Pleodorina starrii]GLC54168.1 hypothetical protein PLESTB_000831000 [Pleodorina starrii]
MKLSTVLHSLRTKRPYSAFATEDIQPMSEIFVSWPKLVGIGWKVGGALVLVSQAFTALQLELFRTNIKHDLDSLAGSVRALQDNVKTIQDNVKTLQDNTKTIQVNMNTMQDSMKTMDEKLTKALAKER